METLDPMLRLELMVDFPASPSLLVIAGPQPVILSTAPRIPQLSPPEWEVVQLRRLLLC